MKYIEAVQIFLVVVGTFLYLWQLTAIIRDALVVTQFKDFIGVSKVTEELRTEDSNKVTVSIIIGIATAALWATLILYK